MGRRTGWAAGAVSALLAVLSFPISAEIAAATGRDALWRVVNDGCVRSEEATGVPFPCILVDLDAGYAILQPRPTHFLVVPTIPLVGIEAPELGESLLPNYWDLAWQARDRLSGVVGVELPRDAIGLAINSGRHRSQDQLHIHLACIRADVRAALQAYEKDLADSFSRLPFAVVGQRYWIMKVRDRDLSETRPFQLMNAVPTSANAEEFTIVVVGANFRSGEEGFYLLVGRSDVSGAASGGGLLDFDCNAARGQG